MFLRLVTNRPSTPGCIRTQVLGWEQARQRNYLAGEHVFHSLRDRLAQIERPPLEIAIVEEVVAPAEIYELASPDLDLPTEQASPLGHCLAANPAYARVIRRLHLMQARAVSIDPMKATYSLILPWSSLEQLLPNERNAFLVRQGYRGNASSDITKDPQRRIEYGSDGIPRACFRTPLAKLVRDWYALSPSRYPLPTKKPSIWRAFLNSGGGIRTRDLRVMSPTSYQTAPPRGVRVNSSKSAQPSRFAAAWPG